MQQVAGGCFVLRLLFVLFKMQALALGAAKIKRFACRWKIQQA